MDIFSSEDLRHLLVTYSYVAILLVVAVEAMGISVPGETMLILASVYAGTTRHLEIGLVIAAASAGAILGDNLGFLAGTRRMAWPRFLTFNAAGGVVWATSVGLAHQDPH